MAKIISDISAKLNSTEGTADQRALMERQIAAQADLDSGHRKAEREADRQLETELLQKLQDIENEMEQQKQLVGDYYYPVNL